MNALTRRLVFWVLIAMLQLSLYYCLRFSPEFIESYYSKGIYPYIARAMRIGLGWIPFSFGDLVYGIGIVLMVKWIIRFVSITLSRKRNTKSTFKNMLVHGIATFNMVLFTFHALWGFNYYRVPLNASLGLAPSYTDENLEKVSSFFLKEANALHEQLQPIDSLPVAFKRGQSELFELAPETYQIFDNQFKDFHNSPISTKKSLLTPLLTYMGYSGYLNPITGEAHTNAWINNYKTPVLILHEMAHQQGYAKENEANFFAIMAGINHTDAYFRYSAMIFGLRYLINDLHAKNPEKASLLIDQMRSGILANYQELTDFWDPYNNNIIEKASQAAYNQYLKANNQPDGMKTYSYVVALLVNYFIDGKPPSS